MNEVTHSLRGEGFDASEDGTGRGTPLVPVTGTKYAYYSHDYAHDRLTDPAGVSPALTKQFHASGNLNVAIPAAIAFDCKRNAADSAAHDPAPTLRAMNASGSHANAGGQLAVQTAMQVRRLVPEECEKLQGFPPGYTDIRPKGKDTPDGPRYKALGNSMAVPVMHWIGRQIDKAVKP